MLDPFLKRPALRNVHPCCLMRQIRADIPVHQNNLAVVQRLFQLRLSLEAVSSVKKGSKVRIDAFQRPQLTVQELPNHFAEPGIVLRKGRRKNGMSSLAQRRAQQLHLRALPAAIDSLNGDQFSATRHLVRTAHPAAVEVSLT